MVAASVGKIALIVAAFVPLAVSTGVVARIADAQAPLPDVRFVATPPVKLGSSSCTLTCMARGSTSRSVHSRVRQLEIRFPTCAVPRQFPTTDDRAAIGGDCCGEPL